MRTQVPHFLMSLVTSSQATLPVAWGTTQPLQNPCSHQARAQRGAPRHRKTSLAPFFLEASLPFCTWLCMHLASEQKPLEVPHRVPFGFSVSIACSGPVTPHVRVTRAMATSACVMSDHGCGAQTGALCPRGMTHWHSDSDTGTQGSLQWLLGALHHAVRSRVGQGLALTTLLQVLKVPDCFLISQCHNSGH